MAVKISNITVNAGRHSARVPNSVEQKDVGVRITSHSVVIFDPENEDHWLNITRQDFKTIAELLQIPGLGHITG